MVSCIWSLDHATSATSGVAMTLAMMSTTHTSFPKGGLTSKAVPRSFTTPLAAAISAVRTDLSHEDDIPTAVPSSSMQRTVLTDITNTTNALPSTTSRATVSVRGRKVTDASLRKTIVALQHRKKVMRRRNAISLTREQATRLAQQLSQVRQHPSNNDDASEAAHNAKPIPFVTCQLDDNLYLVSRRDGHTLTCPPHSTTCTCSPSHL
ncbi:uncharacterized protein PAN0_007c3240 [Moesziomyces antarcticus]|uniref:Uncharacterized protein n=2 Tax=Pseudozyma antarctica TaxID=84753 RepID=A0A5C3FR24_PSEA2|nr:uncharacterized protein PAN0_007c3240 [Moesziomyces antarcticus]GAK65024.1 hypothetical protein PAN0_007c3240 [Moesziomyces antarcticus]SPO45987.1 uncharacterized protein PSANT_03673 [Moesziomyces antarcticus]